MALFVIMAQSFSTNDHTPERYMSNVLRDQVLVLNKNRRPFDVVTVEDAWNLMFRDKARGIDTDTLLSVPLDEWMALSVRENDKSIGLANGKRARIPTVIQTVIYARMPKRKLKNDNQGIALRDAKICQYTGVFRPDGNVDHYVPKSRGGGDSWENKVWCSPEINAEKKNLMPEKYGKKLIRSPRKPEPMEACAFIRRTLRRPDWEPFF